MKEKVTFTIDQKEYSSKAGKFIVEAARENGVFIPTLCNLRGIIPAGSCRVCTVKVNGRPLTACTTPVADGMEIENNSPELKDFRCAVIELLFTEGNHFCPSCEKSGNCELQALAYRFQIMAPRFPFQFNERDVDCDHPLLIHDHNRCIQCKRCIRAIKDEQNRSIFTFRKRGHKVRVSIDPELGQTLSEEMAQKAMDVCPVGSILVKEKGFNIPIGKRSYDATPIGETSV